MKRGILNLTQTNQFLCSSVRFELKLYYFSSCLVIIKAREQSKKRGLGLNILCFSLLPNSYQRKTIYSNVSLINSPIPAYCLEAIKWWNCRLPFVSVFSILICCSFYLKGNFCCDSHVELRQTLESVSTHCHLIERLFFESSKTGHCFLMYFFLSHAHRNCSLLSLSYPGRDDSLKLPTCHDLVNNCSHLTSLTLRGFKLHDYKARVLVKVCIWKFEYISIYIYILGSASRLMHL